MSRELKFRIWSFVDKAFHYFELEDYPSGIAGGVSEPQQFTGLKDKNGKEIYEGDILQNIEADKQFIVDGHWENDDFEREVVEWHDKLGCFGLAFYSKYGGEGHTGREQHIDIYVKNGDVVIGNIHENPELLK